VEVLSSDNAILCGSKTKQVKGENRVLHAEYIFIPDKYKKANDLTENGIPSAIKTCQPTTEIQT